MFAQKWRQYWGLKQDPFACEDADKDVILQEVDRVAVHSGFDRIYGNPRLPAPGIVFGEKGSGKSGLRLMMGRHLEAHNESHPKERVFAVDYIDFDLFFDRFRSHSKSGNVDEVLASWGITEHLDCILSLCVTRFVDRVLAGKEDTKALTRKQKLDLLLLTSLYYEGGAHTTKQAVGGLRSKLWLHSARSGLAWSLVALLTAGGIALALFPFQERWILEDVPANAWHGLGLGIVLLVWLVTLFKRGRLSAAGRRGARAVRVLDRDPAAVTEILAKVSPRERADFVLPHGNDDAVRYEYLQRLLTMLGALDYTGVYVLMDRIDEPSLLSGNDVRMRSFVESILDIKLLQYPRLALKLFLPIEMESLHRNANAEDLKRMRLDKSNLIPELKWTGEELFEIADMRLRTCLEDDSRLKALGELFESGFDPVYLRETLTNLGTPRYAFGFLSALCSEYVRELPGDLPEDDERLRITRSVFDVVRRSWIDATGHLRRTMN